MVWCARVLAVLVSLALLGVGLAENITLTDVEVDDPAPDPSDVFARSVLKAQDDFLYVVASFFAGFFAQFGEGRGVEGNTTRKDPRLLKII